MNKKNSLADCSTNLDIDFSCSDAEVFEDQLEALLLRMPRKKRVVLIF